MAQNAKFYRPYYTHTLLNFVTHDSFVA